MPDLIYICRDAIEQNITRGTDLPPIVIRRADGTTEYARHVEIDGPCRIVYDLNGLFDGARVWIETEAPLTPSS